MDKLFKHKPKYGPELGQVIDKSLKSIYPSHLRQQSLALALIYGIFLGHSYFLKISNVPAGYILMMIFIISHLTTTMKGLREAAFYFSVSLSTLAIVFAGLILHDADIVTHALPGIASLLLLAAVIGNRYSKRTHVLIFAVTSILFNLFFFESMQSLVEFNLLYTSVFLLSLFLIHEMGIQEIKIIMTRYKLEKEQIIWSQISEELISNHTNLQKENIRDSLTGAFNKQHFMETILKRRLNHIEGGKFYVAMMDLDYFKSINDTYGHQAGDQAIKHFCRILENEIGLDVGVVGRYGGDEFMVMFDPIENEKLKALISRIQTRLSAYHIKTERTMGLSVSVGIVKVIEGKFKDSDEVIRGADVQLKLVKEAGKGGCLIDE